MRTFHLVRRGKPTLRLPAALVHDIQTHVFTNDGRAAFCTDAFGWVVADDWWVA